MLWYSSQSLVSTSKFLANFMFLWWSSEYTGCKIQALITHHYRYSRTHGITPTVLQTRQETWHYTPTWWYRHGRTPHSQSATDMTGHMASHCHMVLQTWHATRHHSHKLLQTWQDTWHHTITWCYRHGMPQGTSHKLLQTWHDLWHHTVTLLWTHATYSHVTYRIAQNYLLVFQLGKNILNDCFQLPARLGEDEFKLQDLTKI